MKNFEQITIHVHPGFTEKLDKLAGKLDLTRSQLARNLLEMGYEDAMILEKIGIVPAVQLFRKLKEMKSSLLKETLEENKLKG